MSLINFFVRHVLGIRSEELPWAQDAWNAVQDGGSLRIETDDLTTLCGLDPELAEVRRLWNSRISVLHIKSRGTQNLAEVLDIAVTGKKRGGMAVRFTDGKAVSWNRPGSIRQYEVPDRERYWYAQILGRVRELT